MPELTRANREVREGVTDPFAYHVAALLEWMQARRSRLPAPCPVDPRACAEWWLQNMQPKGTGHRESRAALLAFLDLQPADRSFVVAARQDGVYYRGDNPVVFAKIYEETQLMRKDPTQEYKQRVSDALKAYLKRCRQRR